MGWKSKFVLLLFVYSAGFSTAIYLFGPKPDYGSVKPNNTAFSFENLQEDFLDGHNPKSEKFLQIFNTNLYKGVNISKETFLKIKELLKSKIEERKEIKERKNLQAGFN